MPLIFNISGISVYSYMRGVMLMLDNLFWFVIGFALGFFFFNILAMIKWIKINHTKSGKRKKFREDMEELQRDFKQ